MADLRTILFLIAFCLCFIGDSIFCQDTNLTELHIIILAPTPAGKSGLANMLTGVATDCTNCTFEICSGTFLQQMIMEMQSLFGKENF